MKKFITLMSVVLLAAALTSCGNKDGKTIKIGFSGPLTGDAANYGKLMTQAVKIAVEERNEKGGIAGEIKVVLIPEDTEGKVEKANAVIEKLVNIDRVYGIVGSVFSSCSLAIAPKAQASKTVMISPSSTHKDLTDKGSYIFRNVVTDQLQAVIFAKYVYHELGIKKVAILHLKNDYSQGLALDFAAQFEKEGGAIVITESGLQGDKDFKTQLTKIKGASPEAIYMPNYVPEMAQILEQSKQLGLNVQFLSADGFSNPEIFDLAGDLTENVIFSNSPDESSDVKASFVKKYNEKWGEDPDAFSLNSYDGANIIMDAIEYAYEQDKDIDRETIRKYIAGLKDYEGVSGNITFLPNGDVAKNIAIFTVKKGEYVQESIYKLNNGKLDKIQ